MSTQPARAACRRGLVRETQGDEGAHDGRDRSDQEREGLVSPDAPPAPPPSTPALQKKTQQEGSSSLDALIADAGKGVLAYAASLGAFVANVASEKNGAAGDACGDGESGTSSSPSKSAPTKTTDTPAMPGAASAKEAPTKTTPSATGEEDLSFMPAEHPLIMLTKTPQVALLPHEKFAALQALRNAVTVAFEEGKHPGYPQGNENPADFVMGPRGTNAWAAYAGILHDIDGAQGAQLAEVWTTMLGGAFAGAPTAAAAEVVEETLTQELVHEAVHVGLDVAEHVTDEWVDQKLERRTEDIAKMLETAPQS